MAKFEMITSPPRALTEQAAKIHERYFTVDTAPMAVVWQWLAHNPYTDTYAMLNGEVIGFFNVLPLTTEAGELFEREEIREEDLSVEHILPHESLGFARYAYIAAIAIRDTRQYIDRQCAAALIATMADLFLYGYGADYLHKIFVNPTTFSGNLLVHRLGLQPVDASNRVLRENDIYEAPFDDEARGKMQAASMRYRRFVGQSAWTLKTKD